MPESFHICQLKMYFVEFILGVYFYSWFTCTHGYWISLGVVNSYYLYFSFFFRVHFFLQIIGCGMMIFQIIFNFRPSYWVSSNFDHYTIIQQLFQPSDEVSCCSFLIILGANDT